MRISGQKSAVCARRKSARKRPQREQNRRRSEFFGIAASEIQSPIYRFDLQIRAYPSKKNLRVRDTYAAPDIIENRPTLRNPEHRFPLRVVIFPRRRFSPRRPPATSAAAVFTRNPPLQPEKKSGGKANLDSSSSPEPQRQKKGAGNCPLPKDFKAS